MEEPLLVPTLAPIATRIGLSLVLSSLLGFEREVRRRPAGLRTHMMVGLGATTAVLVGLEIFERTIALDSDHAAVDPLRLLEAVVGGLGFLGAGAILQKGGTVEGLTTAGSIWLVGIVGVACGAGAFAIATVATVLGLVVLYAVARLEGKLPGTGGDDDAGSGGGERRRAG